MNSIKSIIKKMREEKGGFTLAELLVVVAIILVLVAIAIPVFTGALSKADDAVQKADIRSVKAAATTEILLNNDSAAIDGGKWKATATVSASGDVTDLEVVTDTAGGTDSAVKNGDSYDVTVYISATDLS